MNDALIAILSIVGLMALYWALIGQWKHNKMMKEEIKKEDENKQD